MDSRRLYITTLIMQILPSTRLFALKRALLRWSGAVVGKNVRIVSSARFCISGNLSIGDDTWIGHEVLLVGGSADIEIGPRVDIGPRAMLATGTHELFTNNNQAAGKGYSRPIRISEGSWIGAGATILGGSTIGPLSVVAAGALVRRNVEALTLVAGIPAQKVRDLAG